MDFAHVGVTQLNRLQYCKVMTDKGNINDIVYISKYMRHAVSQLLVTS
jgi:hypothetical protein